MGASQLALDGRPLPPTWGRHRPAVTLLAATALSAGALLAAPAAAAAAAAATSAAPASIPAAVPAAALAAGAGLMVGTPPPRRAHRRNSPWVVPAEDPRAAWLAEDLSMDDELVAGGGRGGRGDPVAAGPRGLLTGAGRPLRLTMTASAGAGTATTTPPVEVATAFPSTPAGASGASLAKFVASRPSVDTIIDGQCGHHVGALPLLLRRLGALPATWAPPPVRARGGTPGASAAADAAAAPPEPASPARRYVCVTANRGEQRRVQSARAGAAATVAAAATPGGDGSNGGGGVSLVYRLVWQLEASGTDAAGVAGGVGEQGGTGGTSGGAIAGLHPRGKVRAVAVVAPRGLDDRAFGQAYRRARSGGGGVRWLLTERGGRRGGLQAFQLF